MPTAMESCALLLGGAPTSRCCGGSSLRLLPVARSQRLPAICCKARRKKSSSQLKKQHVKRISLGKSTSTSNHFSNSDDTTDFQTVSPKVISSSHQVTKVNGSSDADIFIQTDQDSSNKMAPLEMEKVMIGKHNGDDLALSIHLDDLVGMIRNVEKNVLLLNDARIHAVEELNKISAEKDLLEREINLLQLKLGQNNASNIDAVDEFHHELDGDNSATLSDVSSSVTEDLRPYVYANGNAVLGTKSHYAGKNLPLITDGLILLREENASLKDEVQTLKMKLSDAKEMSEHVASLEKERDFLEASIRELESKLLAYQEDVSQVSTLKSNCSTLSEKVEELQVLLDSANKQADLAADAISQNNELKIKVNKLEASLEEAAADKFLLDKTQEDNKVLQDKVKSLEVHLQKSEQEISSHVVLYQAAVKEFQETLEQLKAEIKKKSRKVVVEDLPNEFWSGLLLKVDGWLLEKKIAASDAKLLREMAWKRDSRLHDAYSSCKGKSDDIVLTTFMKLLSAPTSRGMHIIHIAAEMAPVSKVGGLGDVVAGISKALQKRGHMLEIILPKYDCMNHEHINDMKMLDVVISSYYDGQLYKNRVWVGTVEGLPVYFIEPQHPANYFARGNFYGEHDDFKRFSFFSRAALELLFQAEKRADIIHCHDWHTAFVAPLYWDIYAARGFDSARICFTCHNFEYQGVASTSELASCGLNVHHMNRQDRLQDNSSHDRINLVKGAIVFSNIVIKLPFHSIRPSPPKIKMLLSASTTTATHVHLQLKFPHHAFGTTYKSVFPIGRSRHRDDSCKLFAKLSPDIRQKFEDLVQRDKMRRELGLLEDNPVRMEEEEEEVVEVKTWPKPRLALKFIWMEKNIGMALDQVIPGYGSVPLSPYYFWPRKDAWEELKTLLESKPWISQKRMIILLNQATDIINLWQQGGGGL